MSTAPPLNGPPVEARLRALLGPLDRHLDRGRTLLAAALVLSPAPFILLWLLKYIEAKHAAGWSVLAFGLMLVLGLSWEMCLTWLARRRFDQRFPEGTEARAAALRLLAEIETPSKVEEKLRDALGAHPHRAPRQSDTDLAPLGEPPLPMIELPPDTPTTLPEPVATRPASPRPGGYYDYIPLEPMESDDGRDGRAS